MHQQQSGRLRGRTALRSRLYAARPVLVAASTPTRSVPDDHTVCLHGRPCCNQQPDDHRLLFVFAHPGAHRAMRAARTWRQDKLLLLILGAITPESGPAPHYHCIMPAQLLNKSSFPVDGSEPLIKIFFLEIQSVTFLFFLLHLVIKDLTKHMRRQP